jgi:hypothetical protein
LPSRVRTGWSAPDSRHRWRLRLATEANAVVRTAIFGIDLSGIREKDTGDGRLERKDPTAVPDLGDWLGRLFAKRPRADDVALVEAWRDALERWYVPRDDFVGRHRDEGISGGDVIRNVQGARWIALRRHEVGVLDTPEERQRPVGVVEPIRRREWATQLQQQHDSGSVAPVEPPRAEFSGAIP